MWRILVLLFSGLSVACATMQPVAPMNVSEYLVPTSDFTMRLPPFLTIEVLKNQPVPIVGSTVRNGHSYRMALLPSQAARGLRFLINDDGSFEGSAINVSGSRMGFSYAPNPPDVKLLAAFEVRPSDAVTEVTPELSEMARDSLDRHLAATLKDPMSAIQYGASDIVQCRDVAMTPPEYRDYWCICYQVNARNSMGGMTGQQYHVASMTSKRPPFLLVDIPRELTGNVNACPNFSPRDAALIRARVK